MTNVAEIVKPGARVPDSPAPSARSGKARWPRSFDKRWYGAAIVIGLLLLWEVSARLHWVASANWPPFSIVLQAAFNALRDGEMLPAFISTIRRASIGYALGSSVGIGLALLLGMNRWLRYLLLPVVEFIRPIPGPAIIPPLILFLGVDDALKIAIIALACFFPVFTTTLAGVFSVDDTYLQTAHTFRLTWLDTIRKVVFPATLPAIAAGLRTAASLALIAAVIVEMVAGAGGIGYFMVQMQYAMRPDLMYAAVIYLAVFGYLLNRSFLVLERSAIPWMGKT